MLNNEDYLNIFHEIKNSISLIGSSLQLIEKRHPAVTDYNYWTETMSEIMSLRNMVTELSSARLCSHIHFQTVNLYDYIRDIHQSIAAISDESFSCELILDPGLPSVELDPQLLKQALLNLIKNAYEAMDKTGTIQLHVMSSPETVQMKVIDHGGGLDPAFADSIFEPFITSKTGGSGLGLVITKQIIESHNGTISCDSRPGDGCTFTLTLPLAQVH